MEKIIQFLGQPAKVNCDENCHKAWGINSRPRIYPEIGEKVFGLDNASIWPDRYDVDENNYVYLSDDELPEAPIDPGTEEGGEKKPVNKQGIPNKWCYRECERCNISDPGQWDQPLPVKEFKERKSNYHD
jgi:hypothetical protein